MEQEALRKILERMVQEGVVSAVDAGRRRVRVKFLTTDIYSGWLAVLQHTGAGVQAAGHTASVTVWMPKVNDRVVVLYLPCPDSDGYVLGGV
ncbi:MAG: phage baseplate assembly protein V [Oscillospiraceae bacterium]|nr:phage baseplate assembly protein V [Oscillospiraceae bacterium]